jgi:hypothetical protein
MKFYCVCGKCGSHADEEASIEFNFRDMVVYFVCPTCKKENKMDLKPKEQPLPKMRTLK